MKTLQEKYNAILEGNFSKKQFVRDARLAHSNLITQFNSFADTVAILKNKGMVVEAKKVEVTAYKKPEVDPIDMVAPDLLDHGIEAELHAAGITGTPSEEEYAKAKEKAAKELIKDPLCYKNAQTMTEPGEKMEKAKLSEETALDRVEKNASIAVQNKLTDISNTVGEEPASVAAAFRKKVLADPTHFGKMSAHELEKEFIKFAEDMKVDKEADEEFDKMSGEPDPEKITERLSPEAHARMEGLVSIKAVNSFIEAAGVMIKELKQEDFEEDDIFEFLIDRLLTLESMTSADEIDKDEKQFRREQGLEENEEKRGFYVTMKPKDGSYGKSTLTNLPNHANQTYSGALQSIERLKDINGRKGKKYAYYVSDTDGNPLDKEGNIISGTMKETRLKEAVKSLIKKTLES